MIGFAYIAHGLTLSLAWFVVINLAASALVACGADVVLRRVRIGQPSAWLALRLGPATFAALFVSLLFVPSYWQYEPREAVEGFDLTTSAIALIGVALLAVSAARGCAAWRAASGRVRQWMRHAGAIDGTPIPCFLVDGSRPMIALSGIWHQRLLITRGLVDTLTPDELGAAIAHELGHRRAWDNLKRLAMRSAPDFIGGSRVAHLLERRWASAAEHVADRAAGAAASTRCALASALVKVARLTPADGNPLVAGFPPITEPISTLIGGGEIASRVYHLLQEPKKAQRARRRYAVAAFAFAALALIGYAPLLRFVHESTETLIRILP